MNFSTDGRPFNIRDELRNISPEEITLKYKNESKSAAVMCFNISGEPNIGMIVRTASLFAFSKVIIVGRKHYDKRSTVGMYNYIPIEFEKAVTGFNSEKLDLEHIQNFLNCLSNDYQLVAIEQSINSISIQNLREYLSPQKPPLFIMGSESEGIPEEILERNDVLIVTIPQWGVCRSFNVANAFSITAWEWAKIENNL